MPYYPPDTDTPVAQLTLEGRNLLARSIVARSQLTGTEEDKALVSFRLSGFAVGDGGYTISNPLQVSTIVDATTIAEATIAILDNRFDVNDALTINGVSFPVGITAVFTGTALAAPGGGTDNGGLTAGYDDGTIDNTGGGGGTLVTAANSLAANAHIGQRLRIIGGTLAGLDEEIVTNTTDTIEIGIVSFDSSQIPLPHNPANPVDGTTVGKSWAQAGSDGVVVPDVTSLFQIITNNPGAGTWVPGDTLEETAANIAEAINASTHPSIQNVVKATVTNAIITIQALSAGSKGNLNTLVEVDAGGLGINNFGILPGTGFLADGADPALENPRYPSGTPNTVAAFLDVEYPNSSATSLVCRVAQNVGNYGLGEIGLYADIIDSIEPNEIGERVLYAIGHFPIVAKNTSSVYVTRVIIQY